MIQPKARFPFIISVYGPQGIPFAGQDNQEALLPMLDKICAQNSTLDSKISRFMDRLALLEPLVNEIRAGAENRVSTASMRPPDEAGEEKLSAFFSDLIASLDGLISVKELIAESGHEEWQRGISLFYDKLIKLLASNDFEISAEPGMAFDSALHEAVDVTCDSGLPSGAIADVIQAGWLYRGKALRYAKVVVAKSG